MPLRRFSRLTYFPCAIVVLTVVGCAHREPPAEMAAARPRTAVAPSPAGTPPSMPVQPSPQMVKPMPPPQSAQPTAPAWVPREWLPGVASRNWRWIVVHHSATAVGGAARFSKEHVANGWDELGYHFVIGNGTDSPNGAIEVGSRWGKQKQGAHCKTPDNRYNDFGIGICLVGNFDQTRPTDAQLQSLAKLVAYLQKSYSVAPNDIIGHGDAKATRCPGRNLHVSTVRRLSGQADLGDAIPAARTASPQAGGELMFEPAQASAD